MDDWTGWAAALLGFLLSILGVNYRIDKKRNEDNLIENTHQIFQLAERITKVETELMTEREVRRILKDYFDPFILSMAKTQTDIQDIKLYLASLPNKKDK